MKLFHVTSRSRVQSIRETGLLPNSYLSSIFNLYIYYCEVVLDDGEDPVLLEIDMDDLDTSFFSPDLPSVSEPITVAIGLSEKQVWSKWSRSRQSWQDCLNIVGSVRYDALIPSDVISFNESVCDEFSHMLSRRFK